MTFCSVDNLIDNAVVSIKDTISDADISLVLEASSQVAEMYDSASLSVSVQLNMVAHDLDGDIY